MKRLLALILLAGLLYGGWVLYQNYRLPASLTGLDNVTPPLQLTMKEGSEKWDNLQSILGASISNVVDTGKEWMSEATNGASEPIVNRAITNFQEELKTLPAEQVERIKYDFCKPIVDDYESN